MRRQVLSNKMMLITLLINSDGFVLSGFVSWLRLGGGQGNEDWDGILHPLQSSAVQLLSFKFSAHFVSQKIVLI